MMVPRLRVALLLAALAAGAALAVAIAAERWGGLVPCALCLVERWPYRIALVLALVGLVLPRPLARVVLFLVALAVLGDVIAACLHVGVERRLWPSPLPECMAPDVSGLSIAQRLAKMPALPSKACEDPVYVDPAVPLSFAELNFVFALGFFVFLAIFAWRSRRSDP